MFVQLIETKKLKSVQNEILQLGDFIRVHNYWWARKEGETYISLVIFQTITVPS